MLRTVHFNQTPKYGPTHSVVRSNSPLFDGELYGWVGGWVDVWVDVHSSRTHSSCLYVVELDTDLQ